MSSVPAGFIAEANQAMAAKDAAKLMLLYLEAAGFAWQDEARALVAIPGEWRRETVDRLILFTGHRIDSADRKEPRFPAEAEPIAKAAIRDVVKRQLSLAQGKVLGVAGGANGGDILFLECCHEAGVSFEMLLALPPEQFIPASVEAETGDWVKRIETLFSQGATEILAQSKQLPQWLSEKAGYDIWQRNNLWLIAYALARKPAKFVLVALWDGKGGDGPGGTEHMVEMAQEHGAELVWLDSGDWLIHSAGR